jgi:hypothetical protein
MSGLTIPVTCWEGDDGAARYNFSSRVYANGDNGANSEPTKLLNASVFRLPLEATVHTSYRSVASADESVRGQTTRQAIGRNPVARLCHHRSVGYAQRHRHTIVGVLSPEEVNVTVSGSGFTESNRTTNLPDPEVLAFEMNCTTPQTVQLNADYYNATGDFSTLTPYKKFEVSRISSLIQSNRLDRHFG